MLHVGGGLILQRERERLNLHVTSFVQDWDAVLRLLNSLRVGLFGFSYKNIHDTCYCYMISVSVEH